jgi:hypothetical protein
MHLFGRFASRVSERNPTLPLERGENRGQLVPWRAPQRLPDRGRKFPPDLGGFGAGFAVQLVGQAVEQQAKYIVSAGNGHTVALPPSRLPGNPAPRPPEAIGAGLAVSEPRRSPCARPLIAFGRPLRAFGSRVPPDRACPARVPAACRAPRR